MITVSLPGGKVRVKLGLDGGRVVNVAPEYADCARLAAATGRPQGRHGQGPGGRPGHPRRRGPRPQPTGTAGLAQAALGRGRGGSRPRGGGRAHAAASPLPAEHPGAELVPASGRSRPAGGAANGLSARNPDVHGRLAPQVDERLGLPGAPRRLIPAARPGARSSRRMRRPTTARAIPKPIETRASRLWTALKAASWAGRRRCSRCGSPRPRWSRRPRPGAGSNGHGGFACPDVTAWAPVPPPRPGPGSAPGRGSWRCSS